MNALTRFLLKCGHSVPYFLIGSLTGKEPAVLLYHSVPRRSPLTHETYKFAAADFDNQIAYLNRYFKFIHPRDIFTRRPPSRHKELLVTFDDGFRNNAVTVAPILRKYNVPALFFVCERHCEPGRYLWFSHLQALRYQFKDRGFSFRGEYYDMSQQYRADSINRLQTLLLALRPHPQAMYNALERELPDIRTFVSPQDLEDWYEGMTTEQMVHLAADPLFSVQAHTSSHPMLASCDAQEAARQIESNKRFIERTCGTAVTDISYPSGVYGIREIDICKALGFKTGYAVVPQVKSSPNFEIPRAGIYRPQKEVAAFKAMWSRRRTSKG